MQVSQNVVRKIHSDPSFKPDKDSVVEQLMGQIRNMEDTISSVLVALEYGPDMATIYRLNQAVSTLKNSGRKEKIKGKIQDTYNTTVKPQANLKGVDDPEEPKANLKGVDDPEEPQANLKGEDNPEEPQANLEGVDVPEEPKANQTLTTRSEEDVLAMNLDQILGINLYRMIPEYEQYCKYRIQSCDKNVITKAGNLLVPLDLENVEKLSEVLLGQGINLPMLEELGLYFIDTHLPLQELLTKCSATLRYLELWMVYFSNEGLDSVPSPKQLEKLHLGICFDRSNTDTIELLTKCSATLKDLKLNNMLNFSGEGLESIPDLKLEILELAENHELRFECFVQLLVKCSATLKHLTLRSPMFYDCEALMESIPVLKLETLRLEYANWFRDTDLMLLLSRCSANLEELRLHDTYASGETLADCLSNVAFGKLRVLGITSCENVTDEDKERIRAALPQCEVQCGTDIQW